MNECMVVGRVAAVPEIKTTPKGRVYASLILESERNFREEDGSIKKDFFNVSVWRGAADQVANVLRPGNCVAVRGRLSGRAVTKEDRTSYYCEVIGETIECITHADIS